MINKMEGRAILTHHDDVSTGIIHFCIVFCSPFQPNIDISFEVLLLVCEVFPYCHKHLKRGDSASEEGSAFSGHDLLDCMQNLHY